MHGGRFFMALLFVVLQGCGAKEAQYKAAGNLYSKQGNFKQAKLEYQKAVGQNPWDPGSYILLGNANFELEEYAQAKQAYEKALTLDARAAEAHRGLALILAKVSTPGDQTAYAAFLQHIEQVVALLPWDQNALLSAAQVVSEHADKSSPTEYRRAQKRAEELLTRLLRLDDRDPKTLLGLMLVYARQGDEETALRVVDRLAQVYQRAGILYWARAVVYTVLEKDEKAVTALTSLLQTQTVDTASLKSDTLLTALFARSNEARLLFEP